MIETQIFCAVTGYFIGSIPTGYWMGRSLKGIDVRQFGSGNLGATNVFRVLGWKAGVSTLVMDMAKGYLAVWVGARWFGSSPWITGLSAIVGHSFSPFVKFQGGKGVATAGGVLVAILPIEAGIALGVFAVFFALSRIVSLSSITAAISLPITTYFFSRDMHTTLITAVIAVFIIWRHRDNIARLLNGSEKPLRIHEQTN